MKFQTPYGFQMDKEMKPLALELYCYRFHAEIPGINTERFYHFRQVVDTIWGEHNKRAHFQWNPWAEKGLKTLHRNPATGQEFPHVAMSGCASSGKTHQGAVYGLVNWLSDPINTMVLVTSTDLKASRKRIWGALHHYWLNGLEGWAPGKFVDSQGIIATIDNGKRLPDTSSLSLIAGEKRKEKENVGKIIGAKAPRVIVIGDELPELSEALVEACFGNLHRNPFFQFIGLGNFKSWYDPFGQFAMPKSGNPDEVTDDVDEYETQKGYCLIFDGLKSPNIISGRNEWTGIFSSKDLAQMRKDFGDTTGTFRRMVNSRPAEIGNENIIYSEAEFIKGEAQKTTIWKTGFKKCSSLDPAYTNGGDRSVQWFGKFGEDIYGNWVLEFDGYKLLREDVTKKDKPRNFQIAEQFRDNCIERGIPPENTALDCTGAGGPFADIVSEVWKDEAGNNIGRKVLRVDFSGNPSDIQVSADSPKLASDMYDRRVTELWMIGKKFFANKQVRGMPVELIREMRMRKYADRKGGDGVKLVVETKAEMKKRLNHSPDLADSAFILFDWARQREGWVAGGYAGGFAVVQHDWDEQVKLNNQVYATVDYSAQEVEMVA